MAAQALKESLAGKQLAKEAEWVAQIDRNAGRMAAMLEELTAATRLESQGSELQRTPCDLGQLVTDLIGRLDEARARRVTIEAGEPGPYLVLADSRQLERCITNLLTNALKYSGDEAPVLIRLARGAGGVELAVVDRGIGIAPENVRQIFDRYFRSTGGKRSAGGLGLGLYIARLIAEAHQGRIDVDSQVGRGSTFKLTLPPYSAS